MSRYAYSHPDGKGVGEHHAAAHGRELPAEMRDLDMAHGTEAEHVATDEDTGALILSWRDRTTCCATRPYRRSSSPPISPR